MPDRNWKAFESPNKEFDENGDDDSKDLDNNFDIADPKPEANTKEGWGFDDDEDEYDGSNDKFVPKDYVLDYINSQGANGAHNDEIKKSYFPEFEPERISHTTMYQIDGLYDLQQAGIIRREGDRWYSNESYKQDQIVDKNPMYSYDGKKREGVYDANKDRKGANEGTTYKHQSGLVNGTESYETVDVDFGGLDSAVEFLRKAGIAKAEKKSVRDANEGLIISYIHHGSKLGVLLDIGCETDFVAKTEGFEELANSIAMQIAATNPIAISKEDLSSDLIDKEKDIYTEQAKSTGKPDNVVKKIVDGKIEKFVEENCLINQSFVKDPDVKIGQLVQEAIAKLGENITINRFVRFALGEKS